MSYIIFVLIKKKANNRFTKHLLLLVFLTRFVLIFLDIDSVYAEEDVFIEVKDDQKMHNFFLQDLIVGFTVLTVTGVNPILGLASSIVISVLLEDTSTLISKKLDDWALEALINEDESVESKP